MRSRHMGEGPLRCDAVQSRKSANGPMAAAKPHLKERPVLEGALAAVNVVFWVPYSVAEAMLVESRPSKLKHPPVEGRSLFVRAAPAAS